MTNVKKKGFSKLLSVCLRISKKRLPEFALLKNCKKYSDWRSLELVDQFREPRILRINFRNIPQEIHGGLFFAIGGI
jgi:hypothetical protein